MPKQAVCHYDPMHNEFYVSATVREEWRVDRHGKFINRVRLIEVDRSWSWSGYWTCAVCGRPATIVDIPDDPEEWVPFDSQAHAELMATYKMSGEIPQ